MRRVAVNGVEAKFEHLDSLSHVRRAPRCESSDADALAPQISGNNKRDLDTYFMYHQCVR